MTAEGAAILAGNRPQPAVLPSPGKTDAATRRAESQARTAP